ncbi:MAG: hypothetical protein AB1938_27570 [Myxococcota bacterium]
MSSRISSAGPAVRSTGAAAPKPRPTEAEKLDKQPIRTWTASGPTPLRGKGVRDAALPAMGDFKGVTNQQLVAALSKADTTRLLELKAGKTKPAALVTPEDGSAKVKAFHMAALGADQTGIEFPLQMAKIGEAEGFRLVLRIPAGMEKDFQKELAKEKLDNVTLVPVKDSEELDFWSEDQGELHVDGSVSVPRSLKGSKELSQEELLKAITKDRLERLHPDAKVDLSTTDKLWAARKKYPEVAYANVGAVGERGGQRAIAAIALGGKKDLRVSNGYIEGGNALVGRRADGTGFAVVGADSISASKAALSKELGKALSEDDVRTLVAQDYGVDVKQLVVVEQPGDFHIDMHVTLLPNGKALVNDAATVFALQKQWLTEDLERTKPTPPPAGASKAAVARYNDEKELWDIRKEGLPNRLKELEAHARRAGAAEARTVKDLEAAGISVERMPGVFPPAGDALPRMNFMNSEKGLNHKGEPFVVALGGDPRAEKLVAQALSKAAGTSVRVHFLDRRLTETTLNAGGGISCRTKIEAES